MGKKKAPLNPDIIMSLFFITFAILFFFESKNLKVETTRFPMICAGLMAGMSLVILVRAVRKMISEQKILDEDPGAEPSEALISWEKLKNPLLVFGMVLVYVLGIIYIGFFVSTAVFIPVFLWVQKYRTWWKMLIVTASIELFVYVVFVYILKLIFPKGLLF